MQKFYRFIKAINQVLLLLIVVVAAVFIVTEVLPSSSNAKDQSFAAQAKSYSGDDGTPEAEERLVEYRNKTDDVFVFVVTSDQAVVKQSLEVETMLYVPKRRGRGQVVNFLFIKENGEKHLLLEEDRVIFNFITAKESDSSSSHELTKNIYRIVETDTNKNKLLDDGDKKSLYVSEYDGSGLKLIMDDIYKYKLVDDDEILIEMAQKNVFYRYHIGKDELTELDTALEN